MIEYVWASIVNGFYKNVTFHNW